MKKKVQKRSIRAYADHLRHRQEAAVALAEAVLAKQPIESLVEGLKEIDNEKLGQARQSVEWFMGDIWKFLDKLKLDIPLLKKPNETIITVIKSEDLLILIDQVRQAKCKRQMRCWVEK